MLEVQNLSAFYGQAQALFDVSLRVGEGEFVVLQGLNGAGKSTLLKAIMGMEVVSRGAIFYGTENSDICSWETHRRARSGLGFVAEDRRLFSELTVNENLLVAASGNAAARQAWVLDLFPPLKALLKRRAAQMSGGEQQMLAIARTLMTDPKLLLLDEPCEGIAPVLVESIAQSLLELRRDGLSMLVAEQNHLLAGAADRLIVLVAGKVEG
jgi:branched-chain amino acid transport system ATP-binding protein